MIARALNEERVLDFCWVGAGALVTQLLATCGADVIKVESSARPDNLRLSPPFAPGADRSSLDRSGYFASRNSNKRSFMLDMRTTEGQSLARRLAAVSTVITSNFRPGVMERWGLGADALRSERPELIVVSMPMQGSDGPHALYSGFGSTIAAASGLTYPSGEPGSAPFGTGTHYPDHVPNPGHALVAILAAIHRRRRTGQGAAIELAQQESTVNIVGPDIVAVSAGEPVPEARGSRHPRRAPHGVFPCAGDDEWCAVDVGTDDEFAGLADVLDHPEWTADARFATGADRKANESALETLIAAASAPWDRWELMDALQARGVAAAAVATPADVLRDRNLNARGYWRRLPHAVMGDIAVNGLPFRTEDDAGATAAAPLLGQHSWEIAESLLGLARADYDRLVRDGVLA